MTLEEDVAAKVERFRAQHSLSFKEALNELLRRALPPSQEHDTPTFGLGEPRLDLDRALALAGALEDEELARKLALRK